MSREKKKKARFQSRKTSAQSNENANRKKVSYEVQLCCSDFQKCATIHQDQTLVGLSRLIISPQAYLGKHILPRDIVACRCHSLHVALLQPIR